MENKQIHKKGSQVETKIRSWSIGKNPKNGNLCIKVNLEGRIQWTGWLTTDSKPYTIKALNEMGFVGANLGMITEENALDTQKVFLAVIGDSRVYEGKTFYEAEFVNDPDKYMGGFSDKNVTQDMVNELNSIDCRGYIEDAKDISSPAASEYSFSTSANFASDDIPF